MIESQKDEVRPLIAWQSFMPVLDTVQHEEELQSAMRGDMALLAEAERKAKAWVDRRQLAAETGLKALAEMSTCKDSVSAAAIYGRWLIGSLNRTAEDLQDAQDFAIKATVIGQSTARALIEGFFIGSVPTGK